MSVQEHAGNDKSCVWHAADFADGELKDELFCIRFASVESELLLVYVKNFLASNFSDWKCFYFIFTGLGSWFCLNWFCVANVAWLIASVAIHVCLHDISVLLCNCLWNVFFLEVRLASIDCSGVLKLWMQCNVFSCICLLLGKLINEKHFPVNFSQRKIWLGFQESVFPLAVFVFRKVVFGKLFSKLSCVCLPVEKLVNGKHFPVKGKFDLVFRKVFSWKIWGENTFRKLWKF